MDSFELNKVAGAVLGTLLFAFGSGFVAEMIYAPKPAGNAGYALPGGEAEGGGGGGGEKKEEAKKDDSIATRLASADVEKGKGGTKACQACHGFDKGGPNKIGPNLWEVVGRKKGSHEGFDYSAGMKEKGYIKGTKMAFQGIGDPKARADVVLYLHSLAESPKPLPEAGKKDEGKKDEKAAEGDKKAEGEQKPDDAKKAEEAKPAEKAAEKPAEAKPDSAKSDSAKPEEKKSEDAKPSEKAAETMSEGKPEDAKKPEDGKAAEKPPEGNKKSEEAKPAEQSGETKPAEEKPADEKPAQP